MKKLINIFVIMIITLFVFSHSMAYESTSVYELNGQSGIITSPLRGFMGLQSGMLGGSGVPIHETAVISPTASGPINLSVSTGNNNVNFIVLAEREQTELGYQYDQFGDVNFGSELAPVPVATYAYKDEEGNITSIASLSEVAGGGQLTFYGEEGVKYYVVPVGQNGSILAANQLANSSTIDISYNYVTWPKGAETIVTDVSSVKFTAPGAEGKPLVAVNENGEEKIINDNTPYQVQNVQTITKGQMEEIGQSVDTEIEEAQSGNEEYDASAFEKMLAWFVTKGIGDNIRKAINMTLGENESVSIDDLLFNGYSNTRLSIFGANRESLDEQNGYLETSGMLDNGSKDGIITKYFMLFRNIAIACYLIILLYMGVRILLASTGSKKSKYKSMIMDWVIGIIILSFFPYVMKYAIMANNAIVSYVGEIRGKIPNTPSLPTIQGMTTQEALAFGVVNAEYAAANGNLMEEMRAKALLTGKLAYAMLYIFLIKELLGFIFIYFKRLVMVIFLITIFPLVTISYAVDKIGDGKSQAFNRWTKEFILNVFLQAFQAINYVVVMSVIYALSGNGGTINIIFTLIGLSYISKGDELLRGMFTKMSGGGAGTAPKSLSEAVKTVATVKLARDVARKVGTVGSRVKTVANNISNVRDSFQNYELAKLNDESRKLRIEEERRNQDPTNPDNMLINNASENIAIALNLAGAREPQEVKDALDRLAILRADPNRRHIFEAEYNKLSESDKKKLNNLMAANASLNSLINNDTGANGKLTEREINMNVSIITDVLNCRESGIYRYLYKFIESQKLLDENEHEIGTLRDALEAKQKGRVLNQKEQEKLKKSQSIFGNMAGIATSDRILTTVNQNSGRLEGGRDGRGRDMSRRNSPSPARLYTMTSSEKESLKGERERILNNSGVRTNNANAKSAANQKVNVNANSAANAIATVKEYQRRINDGRQDGITATEGMELATRLRRLKTESDSINDVETQNVISQFESELGFTIEEFEASAAVTAIVDWQHLEGTEADKQSTLDDAYAIVRRIKTDNSDAAALATINRAEIDRILTGKINAGSKPIDDGQTEEQYRTSETVEKLRKEIQKEYKETDQATVGETRAQLLKNIAEVGTAVASAGLSFTGVAAGMASSAFYAGASGDMNPTGILGAADVGMSIEHSLESIVPGTAYADKKSIGGRIDKGLDKKFKETYKISESTRQADLEARIAKNHSAKNKIESYKSHLKEKKGKK